MNTKKKLKQNNIFTFIIDFIIKSFFLVFFLFCLAYNIKILIKINYFYYVSQKSSLSRRVIRVIFNSSLSIYILSC